MTSPLRCPDCGLELSGSDVCPRCGRPPTAAGEKQSSQARGNPWSFSLAELLIGMTYVCILLAVTLAIPEWGIFLWSVSGFALMRTIWLSIVWKRAGQPYTPLGQAASFAGSLVVMLLISAAAVVAFFGVCMPLGSCVFQCCSPNNSDALLGLSYIFGGTAGLGCGGYLLWRLWVAFIVQWWRTGHLPAFLLRLATLGRSLFLLASTMLSSALLALLAAWTWLLAVPQDDRSAARPRIVLYWMLVAGYVAGTALGIAAGRFIAARVRRWFWPALVAAWLAIAVDIVFLPSDVSGIGATILGILIVLVVGLVIHRLCDRSNSLRDPDSKQPFDKR